MSTKSSIKARPIIFSSNSVRAILENRKTQTINVIKPQPLPHWIPATVLASGYSWESNPFVWVIEFKYLEKENN